MQQQTLNLRGKIFDLSAPQVMGIMNITPDSFYSGSHTQGEEAIRSRAQAIIAQGGTMIDVGSVSTRPGSSAVDAQEEITRLRPALKILRDEFAEIPFSVDTYRADVAQMAVEEYGAAIINDISGGQADSQMFSTIARLQVPYILMHLENNVEKMHTVPNYPHGVTDAVASYFVNKVAQLRQLGVKDIILDPGYGFSKSLDDNYQLMIEQHRALSPFELPVLVGISRKRMIQNVVECTPEEALNGTTVLHTYFLLEGGVQILRVHDVREAVETIRITEKIRTMRAEILKDSSTMITL